MTQEDKELLLKDLCARLPYGVICEDTEGKVRPLFGITPTQHFVITLDNVVDGTRNGLKFCTIDCVKPYLRPMSSMTEEEKREYDNFLFDNLEGEDIIGYEDFRYGIPVIMRYRSDEIVDWLNEHHFDYRGLIENGLALEAPEGMY